MKCSRVTEQFSSVGVQSVVVIGALLCEGYSVYVAQIIFSWRTSKSATNSLKPPTMG